MIPASLHVIDDGLHDLAFANDPADHVDRTEAEKQCALEMRHTARRMIAVYNAWGELSTPMPGVDSLRGESGSARRKAHTPGRGLPFGMSPMKSPAPGKAKMPASGKTATGGSGNSGNSGRTGSGGDDDTHSAVLGLYLGVLVEYKNLHLQLCDALVHLHDVLWGKIASHLERYRAWSAWRPGA